MMKMRELCARTESDPYLIPVAQIKCAALTVTIGVLHPPYTFHINKSGLKRLQVTWLIDKSLADDARLTLCVIPDVRLSSVGFGYSPCSLAQVAFKRSIPWCWSQVTLAVTATDV